MTSLITYPSSITDKVDTITTILISLFVFLAIAECFLPGGIALSIGLSALVMALLRYLEVVESVVTTFSLLPMIAIVFVSFSFKFLNKHFSGETSEDFIPDNIDINNDLVKVLSDIREENSNGKVQFQGSSWKAISQNGTILEGDKAKVVSRDGLVLIVEPIDKIE